MEEKEDIKQAGIKTVTIEYLQRLAESFTGIPAPIKTGKKIVCVVQYLDGSVIDVIHEIVM